MITILATVILYNPSPDILTNIITYAPFVDGILVIDNSDEPHHLGSALKVIFPSMHYLNNDGNLGVAKALNQAACFAVESHYDWLLTMDQDSRFEEGSMKKLANSMNFLDDVGIYTPVHINKDSKKKTGNEEWQIVKKTMTSGNLLNLRAFLQCGPFEEKLFIDYVDHEYNFRLQKKGFKIVRINNSYLLHNLGSIDAYKLWFITMKTTNHNATRRYYITRNRFYVIFKYFSFAPTFFFKEIQEFWGSCWRILILEKNKTEKFRAVASGTLDWFIGNYGKRK